jgi:arsenate reductase (glutaredoxin)
MGQKAICKNGHALLDFGCTDRRFNFSTMATFDPTITIYHNPRCGTSRNTLAMIRNAGIEPQLIEYLQTPPSQETLRALVASMGTSARELLRAKEPLCAELGLDDPAVQDAVLIEAMAAHPVLMNRPVVVTPMGTRLCRPSELVLGILPAVQ